VEELESALGSLIYESLPSLPGKTFSFHGDDDKLCEQRREAMNALCEKLSEIERYREATRRREMTKQLQHQDDQSIVKATKSSLSQHKGLVEMPFAKAFFEVDQHEVKV